MEDKNILKKFQKGDELAFNEIYNQYWKILFMSAYNVLKNKELCEEIIQDVFISIWNKKETLVINVSLKSYLYACVRYKVFNEIKKNTPILRPSMFESLNEKIQNTTPETKLMHKELLIRIDSIVDTLPPKCKEVFKMSRYEYLTHQEIAQKLNISKKTVENHMTRALKTLRSDLGYVSILFLLIY